MFTLLLGFDCTKTMLYLDARRYTGSFWCSFIVAGIHGDLCAVAAFLSAYFVSTYLLSVVGISGLALAVISFLILVFDRQTRRDYEYFQPPYEEPHFPKWDAQMKREMAESKD